jgi:hypothetical protein
MLRGDRRISGASTRVCDQGLEPPFTVSGIPLPTASHARAGSQRCSHDHRHAVSCASNISFVIHLSQIPWASHHWLQTVPVLHIPPFRLPSTHGRRLNLLPFVSQRDLSCWHPALPPFLRALYIGLGGLESFSPARGHWPRSSRVCVYKYPRRAPSHLLDGIRRGSNSNEDRRRAASSVEQSRSRWLILICASYSNPSIAPVASTSFV